MKLSMLRGSKAGDCVGRHWTNFVMLGRMIGKFILGHPKQSIFAAQQNLNSKLPEFAITEVSGRAGERFRPADYLPISLAAHHFLMQSSAINATAKTGQPKLDSQNSLNSNA